MTELTNMTIAYTLADGDGQRSLAVALNVADEPASISLPLTCSHQLAGSGELEPGQVTLPPASWTITTEA